LAALKDGKPRSFATLMGKVGFSHNTLQQHLESLAAKGIIVRESGFKQPRKTQICLSCSVQSHEAGYRRHPRPVRGTRGPVIQSLKACLQV
jgi:DNA-binding HxlR family transcriptional regulator